MMTKTIYLSLFIGILCQLNTLFAQETVPPTLESPKVPIRSVQATKITKSPKIDGVLNDECWKNAPIATDFITNTPVFGNKATYTTEVKIVYDNAAIYISAVMTDPEPAKIARELSARDQIFNANCDYLGIGFDTYDDDQNGYRFMVGASGAQTDMKLVGGNNNGNYNGPDTSWDAVWDSEVSIMPNGWVVEIRIPYSMLRFPTKPVQKWGLQFNREIKRLNELDTWSPVNPKIDGIINQWGELTDLRDIKPPVRLSFSPYAAVNYKHVPNGEGGYGNQTGYNGGMDFKYGINESFTLDMTLVPDFGQVQSDNKVRNLSPFEVQFEERRPFFTEGTELFSRGDLFYSRRVGGRPMGYWDAANGAKEGEVLERNPAETRLYNATKISGRNNKKLGIGFFNAVTAPMYATYLNSNTKEERQAETAPLTNYNVFVLDQALKNNSNISFTNAATWRDGNGKYGRDANVSAVRGRFRDAKNKFELGVRGRLSQIFNPNETKAKLGATADWYLNKLGGNFNWSIGQEVQGKQWDPNDLGIFNGNNYVSNYASASYSVYKKHGPFLESNTWLGATHNMRYAPFSFQDVNLNAGFWGRTAGAHNWNMWMFSKPIKHYDYFEARTPGRQFNEKPFLNIGLNYNSDSRKKVYWGANAGVKYSQWEGNHNFRIWTWPSWRVNNHFTINLNPGFYREYNNVGFGKFGDNGAIVFGKRDVTLVENSLGLTYAATPKSNITFRARHYWNKLNYHSYSKLLENGNLEAVKEDYDLSESYNAFNIDCVYTWQFAPGSFMNVIWKKSIDNYSVGGVQANYLDNLNTTFRSPQNDGITLKVIYFLDYGSIVKRK